MEKERILDQAASLLPELLKIRRDLHSHPELGFELPYTREVVKTKLTEMGYDPMDVGKAGIVAIAGKKDADKCILLRADMDALLLTEEADVEYKSVYDGKMHGCGHDMHTAMLLGAAKLLKEHEDELCGAVKLEFQPAEENFQGSKDMLANGLLENPKVDAAFMIHVVAGMPVPTGCALVPASGGVSMASCEQFHIRVNGKGGHGAMPHLAIDPLTAAAHIQVALSEINSRELDPAGYGVFTTCRMEAGKTSNVIPDYADMWGTIRTIDIEGKDGEYIKTRIREIASGVAGALRCEAVTEFYDHCPCMVMDDTLAKKTGEYMGELLGRGAIPMETKPASGSEDFAFVSHEVPTISVFLSAGCRQDGYEYSQHNPKVRFDDSILHVGAAMYAYEAMRYLEENTKGE